MKERLIGAAVLAVLAVWLIPWLLDGPDEPAADTEAPFELPVPSGHIGEMRTEVIDLLPRRDGAAPASSGAGVDIPASASAPSASQSASRVSGAAPAAAADAPARVRTDGRGATDSETRTGGAAPRTAAESAAPTGAESQAARGDTASAATSSSADSSAPAARNRDASPPGSSSPAASSSAPSSAATARPDAASSGGWSVQLGSFGEEQNARRLADRVQVHGHSPSISTYRANGRVMYRVRIGPHATRAAAEAAASALAAHGFVAQVVTAD